MQFPKVNTGFLTGNIRIPSSLKETFKRKWQKMTSKLLNSPLSYIKSFLSQHFLYFRRYLLPQYMTKSSFQTIHSVSMVTLRDSLATVSHISWLWNFSVFFPSWACSVLQDTKQTRSSVTCVFNTQVFIRMPVLENHTCLHSVSEVKLLSQQAAWLNSSQVWYCASWPGVQK